MSGALDLQRTPQILRAPCRAVEKALNPVDNAGRLWTELGGRVARPPAGRGGSPKAGGATSARGRYDPQPVVRAVHRHDPAVHPGGGSVHRPSVQGRVAASTPSTRWWRWWRD